MKVRENHNFMKKIRKLLRVLPLKNSIQTDKLKNRKTDGGYFIGPTLLFTFTWCTVKKIKELSEKTFLLASTTAEAAYVWNLMEITLQIN